MCVCGKEKKSFSFPQKPWEGGSYQKAVTFEMSRVFRGEKNIFDRPICWVDVVMYVVDNEWDLLLFSL